MTIAEAGTQATTRHTQIGQVISDKRHKTITVEVKHLVKHAKYGKYIYRSINLHAHDEKNEAKQGDRVELVESRPISKLKRWRLVRILEKAKIVETADTVKKAQRAEAGKAAKDGKKGQGKAKGKGKGKGKAEAAKAE